MERKLKLSEAKATFSAVVDSVEARGEPVIIERHGKPVAALVSMEDLERLEQLKAEAPTVAEPKSLLAFAGLWADIPDEEWAEIEAALAAGRADMGRPVNFWDEDYKTESGDEVDDEVPR